jgi:hypothetical protein
VLRDDQFAALERRREVMLMRGDLLQPDKADFWPETP